MKNKFLMVMFSIIISLAFIINISAITWDNTGYYKLDETSGTTVTDATNYNNNLFNNGATVNSLGKINTAYKFDGTNDYLNGTNILDYTNGDSYSIGFWFNSSALTNHKVFGWTHPVDNEGAINIELVNNKLAVGIPYVADMMSYPVIINKWYYVTLTKSGNNYKLYVNGTEVNSSTQAGGVFDVNQKTWIGSYRGSGFFFNGILDEIGIWNRTISPTEVSDLYNSGDGSPFIPEISCKYEYNSVNTTIPCMSNPTITSPVSSYDYIKYGDLIYLNYTDSSTDYSYSLNTYNNLSSLKFYFVNISGTNYTQNINWNYKVFENNRTHNSTAYETANEIYQINLTSDSSLTAVSLIFNGSSYSLANLGNGIWSKSLDIPSSNVGNNSINFSFVYSGSGIVSNYLTYQNVSAINFAICTPALSTKFLNISFKDEESLSSINASIPNSIFTYYLGSGTETKSYSFSTTSNSSNYTFCATPTDKTFHISPYVQYSSTGYPQRTWNPEVTNYNSTLTNQVLYLLGSVDGIYVTYQVTNVADQVLSEVDVYAIRNVFGTNVTIGTGTTGADGTVTFWMNPDFYHYVYFSKTGFKDYSLYHIPTQSSYTIQMGSSSDTEDTDYVKGITYWILPSNKTLFNNTAYTFAFNLSSSFWDVSSFGFNLRLLNGTVLDSDSSSTLESPAEISFNTEDYKRIYMDYYWLINGTYINGTIYWNVMNSENTEWSIKYFFDDLNGILDTGLFGIDEFGKKLIIFLILFFSVGIVGYKFGATSPLTISAITFAIIFFFDVAVNIIPDVGGINNLLTYISALILVILIFREVQT